MENINETIVRTEQVGPAPLLSHLASLPAAERRVAEAVLADPIESMRGSIGALAGRSGTSPATVIRLARRLGHTGFAEWKIALAQERGRNSQFGRPEIPTDAGTETIVAYTLADDAEALRTARQFIDPLVFTEAVERLVAAPEILFVGVGTSGALAQLAAYRFGALGIRSNAISDALGQHLAAANLQPGSVVVAVSHTGSSRDTIVAAETAQQYGALVLGVTSSARSPLAEMADLVLVTGADSAPQHHEVFANRVVHLSLLGALHTAADMRLSKSDKGSRSAGIVATHQF